jgi:hypothetical protein
MPQCQFSVFCCFCVSEKLHRTILGIGRNKSRTSYFYRSFAKTKDETEGGPQAGHTLGWRSPGPGHATRGWERLVHLLTPPFRLYIPLDGKNLNTRSIFHKTYCKPPPSSTRDREAPEALLGTQPERGIPAGGFLHHHGRLWSDVLVYLGLWVHSSS